MRSATAATSARGLTRALGDWHGDGPAYLALARATAALVAQAKVPLGSRLPAERELATSLNLSRTTVSAAYSALRRHGYLISKRGAGSWTALPAGSLGAFGSIGVRPAGGLDRTAELDGIGAVDTIDLTLAASGAGAAASAIAAAAAHASEELPRYLQTPGYESFGLPQLREAIADRYERRGLPTSPDQILVTSGAQQAIDLVLQAFVRPGERVVVESPTYPRALDAVLAHAARPIAIDLDQAGWDAEVLDTFAATLRQAAPSVSYVIADFHNPTGALMSSDMRAAAAAAVHRAGSYLVVDETLADLALDPAAVRSPLPPVAAFDRAGRVISVGSLGKTVWGGLRIGWIRADARLVQRLAAIRSRIDMSGPLLEQLIGVRLLGSYDVILSGRRAELLEGRDVLVDNLRKALPHWDFRVPAGGLSLWVELDRPVSSALTLSAAHLGVRLAPGSRFGSDSRFERRLRVPFTLPPLVLAEATSRLASAVGQVREGVVVDLADLIV
jgi:DNA-binding transcriptional MocR family regulator